MTESSKMDALVLHLSLNGYTDLRLLESGELAGIFGFVFTTGLIVGLDEHSYRTRYCYRTKAEALEALATWNGSGDPPGLWIKQKPQDRLGPGSKAVKEAAL